MLKKRWFVLIVLLLVVIGFFIWANSGSEVKTLELVSKVYPGRIFIGFE